MSDARILKSRAVVPEHVVYRTFGNEAVVVNLQSGKYHGLNPTAARMLDALSRTPTVELAAHDVASALGVEEQRVRCDMSHLCKALEERGLLEINDGADA